MRYSFCRTPKAINQIGKTVFINVMARPNSPQTKINGINEQYIKINIKAIPEKGKANE